jgi:ribosome-associated translation inhibitor RaiA
MILTHVSGLPSSEALRSEISDRISHAVLRFSDRIRLIDVFLRDENGPKKGVDKTCRVVVHLAGMPRIVIEDRSEEVHCLLMKVSARLRQALSRKLGSRKTTKRCVSVGRAPGPLLQEP